MKDNLHDWGNPWSPAHIARTGFCYRYTPRRLSSPYQTLDSEKLRNDEK